MKILVMGCGNILAGDDGVGVRVAEALAEKNLPPGINVIDAGVPGHSLAELMLDYDAVIIVDAILGSSPGKVRVFNWEDLRPVHTTAWNVHGVGVREALKSAAYFASGRFPSLIRIVAVEIFPPVAWSEGLTPPVEASVSGAVEVVMGELNTIQGEMVAALKD